MIAGIIDGKRQAKIPVVITGLRKETQIEALIDTGFSGSISLPIELAIELGLELTGRIFIELADGSIKKELVFEGKTRLDEKEKKVQILLNDSDQTLLGTNLLSQKKLELNFPENKVNLI